MQVWRSQGLVELERDASENLLVRALRRHCGRGDDRVPPRIRADLAYAHGRRTADQEMTADQTVERAATKLQQLANQWAGRRRAEGEARRATCRGCRLDPQDEAQPDQGPREGRGADQPKPGQRTRCAVRPQLGRKKKKGAGARLPGSWSASHSPLASRWRSGSTGGAMPTQGTDGRQPRASAPRSRRSRSARARSCGSELELAAMELKGKVASLGIGIGLAIGSRGHAPLHGRVRFATIAAGLATAMSTWRRSSIDDRHRARDCGRPRRIREDEESRGDAAGPGAGDHARRS